MHLLLCGLLLLTPVNQEKTQDKKNEPIYTADSQWVTVAPPQLGVKFAMPAYPEHVIRQFDNVVPNHKLTVHQYKKTINNSTANFVFAYHDIHVPVSDKKAIKETLDGAVKGATFRVFGKLISHKAIQIRGYPGREYEFIADQGGTILKFSARVYLVKQRLYQLNLVMTDDEFDEAMVQKFFKSFDLVKVDADLPPKPTKIRSE